jgi:hypothetical protein
MRLFEVEDRFVDDLVTILRNLRGRSDSKDAPAVFPYAAVNNLLQPLGYGELSKMALVNLVKQHPDVNKEIKTFDDENIVLKTEAEKAENPTNIPNGPSVDQMAHQGAQNFQQKQS